MSSQPKERVPDWLLERIAAEDLSDEKMARALARLEAEPDGMRRLQDLREQNERWLQENPPQAFAAGVHRKLAEEIDQRELAPVITLRRVAPALALAASLLCAFALFGPGGQGGKAGGLGPGIDTKQNTVETTRIKGAQTQLRVYRKTGAGSERLEDGAVVTRGDVLQLQYLPAGARYGVIFSMDGRNQLTLHHPLVESGSTRLKAGPTLLEHSFELDDAPRYEQFIFVHSDKPLDAGAIMRQAKREIDMRDSSNRPLQTRFSDSQREILLKKERKK